MGGKIEKVSTNGCKIPNKKYWYLLYVKLIYQMEELKI
jgi:hypothetical protein